MQKDGLQTLEPTALAIKQVPSSSATLTTMYFPDEITITLRHMPQPEHLSKNCGRSDYTTYQAFFVNSSLNTKAFLGPFSKLRPGTFQLIAENIPDGTWDQLVISLAPDDPSELGMPIFILSDSFSHGAVPPERYTALPADFPRVNQCQSTDMSIPETKQYPLAKSCGSSNELLEPDTSLPELNNPSATPVEETINSHYNEDDSLLLQPGTVLPEDGIYTDNLGVASPSHKKIAPMDGPTWFNLGDRAEQSDDTLVPIVISELPNHALWLVNYQGIQLVGYTFDPANPKKPMLIVHGVPGDHRQKAKPKEQGYNYWVAHPAGKAGFWLRYVNPIDNLVVYPFPIK